MKTNSLKSDQKAETQFSISTIDYSESELSDIAKKIHSGEIFASWMVSGMDSAQLSSVFIPLDKTPLKPLNLNFSDHEKDDVVHVFQYIDQSFFKKENGYPSFKNCYGLKLKYVKPLMNALNGLNLEKK